ncbi:hypothetical protein [Dethiosulfatarculus sandiegensis]|uniref:Type II secretion system protein n=1 Tax=Dethiosulfatarculus sandiegensis TaxID=1429043 RepID=A0A0D2HTL9_9BACT|nr:hypothetical protein [Dethiosulfatarculus sandiegensis]KIX13843.1 hypothetical protein X474_11215 [Dethiosulfatarculus sandiegensis]
MSRRAGGFYTMEALALVSVLCIAGIFVFSHYSRQMEDFNQQAGIMAQKVPALVEAFFTENPEGRLSREALEKAGFTLGKGYFIKIPAQKDRASDWQVNLWHKDAEKQFVITAEKITQEYR